MTDPKMQILQNTAQKLLRRGAYGNLSKLIGRIHPADIAHLLPHLPLKEQRQLFNLINDRERAADVLSELSRADAAQVLEVLDKEIITEILQEMAYDDAVEIIRNMPEALAEAILTIMEDEDSEEIEQLLGYDEYTAGGIMSTEFFALNQDLTVGQAIASIQEMEHVEMVFYLYVTDEHGHMVGVLSLRQLLTVPPRTLLRDVMVTDVIRVRTDMEQEEVARMVSKYNILAVPVVDEGNRMMGIITVDDVIDVIQDEATEDMMIMAGANEEELDYGFKAFRIARLRLPWLLTTLLGGTITGSIMWWFRLTIEQAVVLVSFVPVITGMGGNVGGQTSMIVVRGFATGRIDFNLLRQVFFKELRVGLIMGTVCGFVIACIALIWHHNLYLGLVVGVSMATAITVAAMMGVAASAFFKKVGIDPAIAASPFVQTSNDITGILIYFATATFFLTKILA